MLLLYLSFIFLGYSCKHFFGVFWKFPCYGFNQLSSEYIKSPFLTIDDEFKKIDGGSCVQNECERLEATEDFKEEESKQVEKQKKDLLQDDFGELKKRSRFHKTIGTELCETLQEIKTLSFLAEDPTILGETLKYLKVIKHNISVCENRMQYSVRSKRRKEGNKKVIYDNRRRIVHELGLSKNWKRKKFQYRSHPVKLKMLKVSSDVFSSKV